jgi:hypothetical protein
MEYPLRTFMTSGSCWNKAALAFWHLNNFLSESSDCYLEPVTLILNTYQTIYLIGRDIYIVYNLNALAS